jgi:DNA-binding response OmpR family regulator
MKNLNILIIEDESLLALTLSAKLQGFGVGFVNFVCSYDEALDTLEKNSDVNLLIVDINLNDDVNGIELVDSLNIEIDVIYLTAYSDDKTISSATKTLPLGYIVKPVNMQQLSILLNIAKEKVEQKMSALEIIDLSNGYMLDIKKGLLMYDGSTTKLTGKKLQLLKILIEEAGVFILFEDLESRLYQTNPRSESALRTLIYRLRAHFNFDIIETEKYYGVRLKL